MGACSLGQLDGEVDHGALPGRADLRVDGAASEDRGLAAAALFAERGLQPGGVVHGSVAALVLHRHGHGHQLALYLAQGGLAPHGAAVSTVFHLIYRVTRQLESYILLQSIWGVPLACLGSS